MCGRSCLARLCTEWLLILLRRIACALYVSFGIEDACRIVLRLVSLKVAWRSILWAGLQKRWTAFVHRVSCSQSEETGVSSHVVQVKRFCRVASVGQDAQLCLWDLVFEDDFSTPLPMQESGMK